MCAGNQRIAAVHHSSALKRVRAEGMGSQTAPPQPSQSRLSSAGGVLGAGGDSDDDITSRPGPHSALRVPPTARRLLTARGSQTAREWMEQQPKGPLLIPGVSQVSQGCMCNAAYSVRQTPHPAVQQGMYGYEL